jgi:hypothetical protein
MNEHGIFTFLSQRQKECTIVGRHEYTQSRQDPLKTTEAWCCCRSKGHCFAEPGLWNQMRALPFVQSCVPLEREGCVSRDTALRLIEALLKDIRLHTTISLRRNIPISVDFAACTFASTMLAQTYIPKEDLERYFHYRSRLGNTRTHEIRQDISKRDIN